MPFDNRQPAVFPSPKLYYIAASVLILYWLLLLFPQIAQGYSTGLDQSWHYALSYFPGSRFLFGRDVAFTFGPLGYLFAPVPVGAVFLKAALIKLAAYLLLAAIMFVYWRETKNKWALVAFLLFQILLQIFVFGENNTGFFDQHLIFQIGLLAGLAVKRSRWGKVAMIFTALLAAISLYIKASNGIAAGAILGLAGVVLLASRRELWKTVLASWLVYVVAVALLSLLLLGSLAHLLPWLKASYEIVRGYSSTMSLQGPRGGLVRALLAVAIYAGLGVWLIRRRLVAGGMAIALGGAVFVFFKAGFVRQDGHELFLFLYLPMLMSILILLSESAKATAVCLACAVVAALLGLPSRQMHWNQFIAPYPVVKRMALLETTWENITVLSHPEDARQQLARQSQINLRADQLPEDWLNGIDRNAQTVDTVPWEINYCPANDLRWNPTPTLQLYTAYTAWLDNWDAEHFIDRRTPDFVIVDFTTIDYRHMLWSTPATWRALLTNYSVAQTDLEHNRFLLRKKDQMAKPLLTEIGEAQIAPNQWVEVPESTVPIYAELEMSLTLGGKLRQTFFRLLPIHIEVVYESGHRNSFRITPEVVKNGLLMNYLPDNPKELADLFNCQAVNPIRRFKITGRGADFLTPAIKLRWKQSQMPCAAITPPLPQPPKQSEAKEEQPAAIG